MPATMTKVNGKWQVSTPNQVHAKGTTRANALAQMRLLNGLEHGWKPTRSRRGIGRKKRSSA